MSSLIVEVCEIKNIESHPNADRLDIAQVKGWNCIVGKNQYKIGDWVVFFPPDSIIPNNIIEKYELEFLKKDGRVGTLKLRGFISQGLVLPVTGLCSEWIDLGDNVADILGIKKYEVQERIVSKSGKITSKKVQNPYFSKYTEIENVKNFDREFQEGDIVVITEKIHGSNIRFGWLPIEINFKNGNVLGILRSLWKKYILGEKCEFVYGSHNVQLQFVNDKNFYGKNIYAEVLKGVDKYLLPAGYIFYGEVYGKGVQDLEYGKSGLDLALFDIKNIQTGEYIDILKMFSMCTELGLMTVPILYQGQFDYNVLKKCTEGQSSICPTQLREGCVVKPILETNSRKLGRLVLKSINPEYLLRKKATEYK